MRVLCCHLSRVAAASVPLPPTCSRCSWCWRRRIRWSSDQVEPDSGYRQQQAHGGDRGQQQKGCEVLPEAQQLVTECLLFVPACVVYYFSARSMKNLDLCAGKLRPPAHQVVHYCHADRFALCVALRMLCIRVRMCSHVPHVLPVLWVHCARGVDRSFRVVWAGHYLRCVTAAHPRCNKKSSCCAHACEY